MAVVGIAVAAFLYSRPSAQGDTGCPWFDDADVNALTEAQLKDVREYYALEPAAKVAIAAKVFDDLGGDMHVLTPWPIQADTISHDWNLDQSVKNASVVARGTVEKVVFNASATGLTVLRIAVTESIKGSEAGSTLDITVPWAPDYRPEQESRGCGLRLNYKPECPPAFVGEEALVLLAPAYKGAPSGVVPLEEKGCNFVDHETGTLRSAWKLAQGKTLAEFSRDLAVADQ